MDRIRTHKHLSQRTKRMDRNMIYTYLDGHVYASIKSTGEMIWDEDIAPHMGNLILCNLPNFDNFVTDDKGITGYLTIDMPLSQWMTVVDYTNINDFTPKEDDYFQYFLGLEKRVIGNRQLRRSSIFLRIALYLTHVNPAKQKPKLELVKQN